MLSRLKNRRNKSIAKAAAVTGLSQDDDGDGKIDPRKAGERPRSPLRSQKGPFKNKSRSKRRQETEVIVFNPHQKTRSKGANSGTSFAGRRANEDLHDLIEETAPDVPEAHLREPHGLVDNAEEVRGLVDNAEEVPEVVIVPAAHATPVNADEQVDVDERKTNTSIAGNDSSVCVSGQREANGPRESVGAATTEETEEAYRTDMAHQGPARSVEGSPSTIIDDVPANDRADAANATWEENDEQQADKETSKLEEPTAAGCTEHELEASTENRKEDYWGPLFRKAWIQASPRGGEEKSFEFWDAARRLVGPIELDPELFADNDEDEEEASEHEEASHGQEEARMDVELAEAAVYPMHLDEGESLPVDDEQDETTGHVPAVTEEEMSLEMVDAEDAEDGGDDDSSDDSDEEMDCAGSRTGVDLLLLTRILDEGMVATRSISKSSDVVIVIGDTGVGKSTFIQAVNDKKIVRDWDSNIHKASFKVDESHNALIEAEIGHGLRSHTRHVQSVFRAASQTYFIDSSGFDDTNNTETDIATSICVRELAKRAGRLRFVVLISAIQFYSKRAVEVKRNLDVVSKFIGHNFMAHKESFVFLFTHCDHAFVEARDLIRTGAADDDILASMKQTLLSVLKETRKATPKSQTRELVKFLKTSLENGEPFCDVFDPVLSNIEAIRENVQPASARNSMTEPEKFVRCSLTYASTHAVRRELESRQAAIRSKLDDGQLDESIVSDVRAVCSFSNHMELVSRKWVEELKSHLLQECSALKDDIHGIICSAGDDETTPGSNEVGAARMSMERLCFVRDLLQICQDDGDASEKTTTVVDCEEYASLIRLLQDRAEEALQKVTELRDYVLGNHKELPLLSIPALTLKKLSAWASVFEDVAACLCQTKERIRDQLLTVTGNNGEFYSRVHADGANKALRMLIVQKAVRQSELAAICLNPADKASLKQLYPSLVEQTRGVLNRLTDSAREAMIDAFSHPPGFDIFVADKSGTVHHELRDLMELLSLVNVTMKSAKIRADLSGSNPYRSATVAAAKEFEERSQICLKLLETAEEKNAAAICFCFVSLRYFANSMPNKRYLRGLEALEQKLLSKLNYFVHNIDFRCSELRDGGFTSSTDHRKSLDQLRAFSWVDSLDFILHNAEQRPKISDRLATANASYSAFVAKLRHTATGALSAALPESTEMDMMCEQLAVVVECFGLLHKLCSVAEDVAINAKSAASLILQQMLLWCDSQRTAPTMPDSLLLLDVKASGRNNIIAAAFKSLPVREDVANLLAEYLAVVENKLATYRVEIEDAAVPPLNFETSAQILEKLSELAQFPELASALPSFGAFIQKVQDYVHSLVSEIDALVSSGSPEDFDAKVAEQKLGILEDAMHHLGKYLKRDKVLIAPLRRSIELRKAEHDTRLKGFIEDNDFPRIKRFLEDMSLRSVDQHRLCLKLFSAHLWLQVESIRQCISGPADAEVTAGAKDKLELLRSAEAQFNGSIRRFPAPREGGSSWELDGIAAKLEKEICKELGQCIQVTITASNDVDYASALLGIKHCRVLHELCAAKNNRDNRLVTVEAKVNALFSRPRRNIDDFLSSLSGAGGASDVSAPSFPPATGQLHRSLSALRKSALRPDCQEEIADLYASAKEQMTRGLMDLCDSLENEWKDGQFTRAQRVLVVLQTELKSGGLQSHVSLNLNIDQMLEEVANLRADRFKTLQATQLSKDTVDKLAQQLDQQKKSWFTVFALNDYHDNCAAAVAKVKEFLRETVVMIRRCEFIGLKTRSCLLCYASRRLHNHFKNQPLKVEVELISSLQHFFARTLSGMETALVNSDMDHMKETWFVSFHEFIREMQQSETGFDPTPALNKICSENQSRAHQSILNHCKSAFAAFDAAVENMDFGRVRQIGEKLNDEIGKFLVCYFEFYYHECCRGLGDSHLDELVHLIRKKLVRGNILELGRSFAVLRVDPTAGLAEVKKSSKRMKLLYHPDKNKDNRNSARFLLVKEASDLLEDPKNLDKFRSYDFPFLLDAVAAMPESLQAAFSQRLDNEEYKSAVVLFGKMQYLDDVLSLVKCRTGKLEHSRSRTIEHAKRQAKRHADALRFSIANAHDCQDFVKMHHVFSDLESFEAAFKAHKEIVGESLALQVLMELENKLLQIKEQPPFLKGKDENLAAEAISEFAGKLILLGRYLEGFPRLKKKASSIVHGLLNSLVDEDWGVSFIFKLGWLLEKGEFSGDDDDKRVGRVIVGAFPHFQDVRAVVFNTEVVNVDTAECLDKTTTQRCDGDADLSEVLIDRHTLGAECDKYDALFEKFFSEYVQDGPEQLVKKVLELVSEVKECRVSNWGVSAKKRLTEILAGVFATFTIMKSGESFRRFREHEEDSAELDTGKGILFRPHKIQIIAVLRLLGIGTDESTLTNHIMEIRTGEGKSIILGALAVVLSLLGFSVRCVCYSEHLSERDRELFKEIFFAFGVTDRVTYSKITTMSEDSVAAEGNIRQLTANMLRGLDRGTPGRPVDRVPSFAIEPHTSAGGSDDQSHSEHKEELIESGAAVPLPLNGEQILLVDEVDVFFGPDFYGQTYNQVAELAEKSVQRLMTKLWQSRRKKPSFHTVSRWAEYSSVIKQFSGWTAQIETEVRKMVSDLQDFATPAYEVDPINVRLGYRSMDSVDWDLTYGYRTAFAYLNEAEKGTLKGPKAESVVQRALSLRISCGQFSYANISPAAILGVSGTLGALSSEERLIVNDFKVSMYSFVPSVYGKNNFRFDKAGRGITIESEKTRYLQSIAQEMKQAIGQGRSAIAFFEDDDRLLEFRNSVYWKEFRHGNVLSSTSEKETRRYVINKAATSGQVTISTAAFGRGTDFFCKDSKLEAAGGMLVIQAFLSVEKTEEVQICGRTARQGKSGSYCMILLETDLMTKFQIKEGAWESIPRDDLYEFLHSHRTDKQKEKLAETRDRVIQSAERDSLSRGYLDALVRRDYPTAKTKLDQIYEFIKAESRQLNFCRMVCLSDATGSMQPIWDATRDYITEMLRRIEELGEGRFELLWVAYRDYSDDNLIEKSKWSKNPDDLVKFVSNIRTGGGGDYPEAVEEALHVARKEHKREDITRVLLIGDAPPHPERKGQPVAYHDNRLMTTDYHIETSKLKRDGIPVYTFRLTDEESLVETFKYMAEETGGEAHALDLDSSGANSLIDCVCETALGDIGGSDLVAEYRERNWN